MRRTRARRTRAALTLVGLTLVGLTLAGTVLGACRELPSQAEAVTDEADAARWRPWLLAQPAELRPPAPPAPGSAEQARDLDAVLAAQRDRSTAVERDVARWNVSATAPWDSSALQLLDFYFPLLPDVRLATPVRAARVMALLHVAVYDALVATWDAKYAYRRPSPARADPRVRALATVGDVPSYPSEHAAAAAAAAAVLAGLFPGEDTLALHAMARAAGASRIAAGVAYPSDVAAGAAIGRAVAVRALARAATDGAAESWTGTPPIGDGLWSPTPSKFVRSPFDPRAGQWRPWVLRAGSAFRPPPPPALTSAAFAHDLGELRQYSVARTVRETDVARYWATDAPSVIWEKDLLHEIAARKLGTMHAARAQVLASVAMYDAFVACWDAKFTYWLARPVTVDASLRPVFPTPPFPSYPSGHSTISTAAAEVFADLFPDAAQHYRDRATEASLSRVYAAVHFRFDVETGDSLGARVGRAVVARGQEDRGAR